MRRRFSSEMTCKNAVSCSIFPEDFLDVIPFFISMVVDIITLASYAPDAVRQYEYSTMIIPVGLQSLLYTFRGDIITHRTMKLYYFLPNKWYKDMDYPVVADSKEEALEILQEHLKLKSKDNRYWMEQYLKWKSATLDSLPEPYKLKESDVISKNS